MLLILVQDLSSRLADNVLGGSGVEQKSNNETVKTQDFCENENQNHTHKKSGLLGGTTDTGVTHNANSETGGQTRETDRETGTKLDETSVEGLLLLERVRDKHRDDEPVNGNDTGHNDGDNILDEQVGAENGGGADTDTGLGGTVGSTKAGEDNGGGAAKGTEEGRVDGASLHMLAQGNFTSNSAIVFDRDEAAGIQTIQTKHWVELDEQCWLSSRQKTPCQDQSRLASYFWHPIC